MSSELDEFRLVRPLGRGGMGEVYLGHDTVLDRAVAIKLIGSRTPDATSRERFLIEARAIARLSHPNVVTIYRVGTTGDGRPFLVQELIRGQSLDRVARPMPWRRVCELAIGIARGLEAAHRRGILHRDVKPANVMLDEHGTARLLDFGLAKLTGGGAAGEGDEGGEGGDGGGAAGASAATAGGLRDGESATPDERRRMRGAIAEETRDVPAAAAERGDAAVAETRDVPAAAAERGDAAVAETRDVPASAVAERSDSAVAETRDVPEAAVAEPRDTPGGAGGGPGAFAAAAPLVRTATGFVLGTPRYTAPELWRGEPASVRSELYSLGVLLYELLAGTAPHPFSDVGELPAVDPIRTCPARLRARLRRAPGARGARHALPRPRSARAAGLGGGGRARAGGGARRCAGGPRGQPLPRPPRVRRRAPRAVLRPRRRRGRHRRSAAHRAADRRRRGLRHRQVLRVPRGRRAGGARRQPRRSPHLARGLARAGADPVGRAVRGARQLRRAPRRARARAAVHRRHRRPPRDRSARGAGHAERARRGGARRRGARRDRRRRGLRREGAARRARRLPDARGGAAGARRAALPRPPPPARALGAGPARGDRRPRARDGRALRDRRDDRGARALRRGQPRRAAAPPVHAQPSCGRRATLPAA